MIGVFAALDAAAVLRVLGSDAACRCSSSSASGAARGACTRRIKFFLYTFLGSLLMLVALIYMYLKAGTYEHRAACRACR